MVQAEAVNFSMQVKLLIPLIVYCSCQVPIGYDDRILEEQVIEPGQVYPREVYIKCTQISVQT